MRQVYIDAHQVAEWSGLKSPDVIARTIDSTTAAAEAGHEAVTRRRTALGACNSHPLETTLAESDVLRHMEATRAVWFIICSTQPSGRYSEILTDGFVICICVIFVCLAMFYVLDSAVE